MHNVACQMSIGTVFFRSVKYNRWDPELSFKWRGKIKKDNTIYLVHISCFVFLHSIAIAHSTTVNRITAPLGSEVHGHTSAIRVKLLARKTHWDFNFSLVSYVPKPLAGCHAVSTTVGYVSDTALPFFLTPLENGSTQQVRCLHY